MARFAFADIYYREYGEVLKPKDWGFGNVDDLVRALGEILEVRMNFTKLACSLFSLQTVHLSSLTHLRALSSIIFVSADSKIRFKKIRFWQGGNTYKRLQRDSQTPTQSTCSPTYPYPRSNVFPWGLGC